MQIITNQEKKDFFSIKFMNLKTKLKHPLHFFLIPVSEKKITTAKDTVIQISFFFILLLVHISVDQCINYRNELQKYVILKLKCSVIFNCIVCHLLLSFHLSALSLQLCQHMFCCTEDCRLDLPQRHTGFCKI